MESSSFIESFFTRKMVIPFRIPSFRYEVDFTPSPTHPVTFSASTDNAHLACYEHEDGQLGKKKRNFIKILQKPVTKDIQQRRNLLFKQFCQV